MKTPKAPKILADKVDVFHRVHRDMYLDTVQMSGEFVRELLAYLRSQETDSDDRGGWIQTRTGRQFFPLNPKPEDVCLEDIAHPLAMQCRFTGHCKYHYSIAQHSVLVSLHCDPQDALWGLLHDASEAYLVDVPRPLKRIPEFAEVYLRAEKSLMDVICAHFGLPTTMPGSVHFADGAALATEKRDLMAIPPAPWEDLPPPWPEPIKEMSPEAARDLFYARFHELVGTK